MYSDLDVYAIKLVTEEEEGKSKFVRILKSMQRGIYIKICTFLWGLYQDILQTNLWRQHKVILHKYNGVE